MLIAPSARKHGISDADMLHAERFAVVSVRQQGDQADRILKIGLSTRSKWLEVVVISEYTSSARIIHAMQLRRALQKRFLTHEYLKGWQE